MSMVFCRGCAKELHETALMCPQCGAPQGASTQAAAISASGGAAMSMDKKFHIVLACAAAIAALLLYTTSAFGLIGLATGITCGLSVRLFVSHQKRDFQGTSKWSWFAILLCAIAAFGCLFFQAYSVQAVLLVFVAVRSSMLLLLNGTPEHQA
jgi:hypothetical protein